MAPHWRRIERDDPQYGELVVAVVLVWEVADTLSALMATPFAGGQLESNPLLRGLMGNSVDPLAVKLGTSPVAGLLALAGERFVRTLPW